MVANYCSQWGPFDEVWLMVSRMNPLKQGSNPASEMQRLEMARIVAEKCAGVKVSDFELYLPSPSYSYVTLCKLKAKYPEHDFNLIIGSDNWVNFGRWRDAHRIISEFGLVVFARPGYELPTSAIAGVTLLEGTPTAQISSTFIRDAVVKGANINGFVACDVADYIKKENLYVKSSE